jgi:archaellum component FlaG (FlaF/FlaG flagellin family)
MESSIPALVIAAILIIGGVLIAGATTDSISTVNDSWRDMEAISEERLGTEMAVISTSLDPGGTQLTATLRNSGRTSISDFEHMDVIVNYDGTDATRYNRWVPFSDDIAPPANTWTVAGIANDFRNPGILDTGEDLTISVQLSPAADAAPERWITISTNTGITYSAYF